MYKHYFKFCPDVFRIPFTFSLGAALFGFGFSYFCALFTHKLETRNAKQKMPLMMMLLLLLLSLLLSWKFSLRFGRHYEPRSALSRPARTHRTPSPVGLFFWDRNNNKNEPKRQTRGLVRSRSVWVRLSLVKRSLRLKAKTENRNEIAAHSRNWSWLWRGERRAPRDALSRRESEGETESWTPWEPVTINEHRMLRYLSATCC